MYKITGATINRNKLFLLNEIEHIEYNPVSPYQVLMGSNGSGKSTLLRLLSGHDPDANEFHKGGSVRLHLDADGTRYEVGYDINGTVRYTFKVDGDELNDGGTREVYRALWREELGFSHDTMQIMMGKHRRITRMKTAERQALFATVTGVDMTYGFSAYDKVRKRAGGVKGAIREDKDLIAKLEAQRINPEEVVVLRARVLDYRSKATHYMEQYNPNLPSPYRDVSEVKAEYTRVRLAMGLYLHQHPDIGSIDADSMMSAEIAQVEMAQDVGHLQRWVNDTLEQYTQMDDLQTRMQVQLSMGGQELGAEYEELRARNAEILSQPYRREDIHYPDPQRTLEALERVLPQWQQDVVAFRGTMTQSELHKRVAELTERMSAIRGGISRLEHQIEAGEQHLKQLREHQCDNCIKCGYSAAGEVRDNSIKVAEAKLIEQREHLAKGYAALRLAQEDETPLLEYRELLQAILRPEFEHSILKPYFGALFNAESLFDSGSSMVWQSSQLYFDVKDKVELERNERRLAEIDKLTSELQSQSIGSMESLSARVESLRRRYEDYVHQHADAEANQKRHRTVQLAAEDYYRSVEGALSTWDGIHSELESHIEYLFNTMCLAAYKDYNEAATQIESQLQDVGNLEVRITAAQEHLSEMERKYDKLCVLISALSPQSGLLAKCAVRPVEQFVEQMNRIIERVWTHELTVLPYKQTANIRLDYTFPMRVAGREHLVPDIADGSDGQLEIIDFAFMIVALLRKGNKGMPLMLDETDRPLQPAHKENLMVLLREMVEAGWFSQILVISHHVSAYSALPQADIIELNPQASSPEVNRVINFK